MDAEATYLDQIVRILGQVMLDGSSREALATGLRRLFDAVDLSYEPDFALASRVRVDFRLGRIMVLVASDGAIADVARRIGTVTREDVTDAVIVVVGREVLAGGLRVDVAGKPWTKPVRVVRALTA